MISTVFVVKISVSQYLNSYVFVVIEKEHKITKVTIHRFWEIKNFIFEKKLKSHKIFLHLSKWILIIAFLTEILLRETAYFTVMPMQQEIIKLT